MTTDDKVTVPEVIDRLTPVARFAGLEEWRNVTGATPPDWLQGRGQGVCGGNLIITADGITFTVHPGDVLFYAKPRR